jgi:hypothetical protein
VKSQVCGNTPPNSSNQSTSFPLDPCGNYENNHNSDFGNYFYIPNSNSSQFEIKVNIHVMQYSTYDPRNFTNTTAQVNWIKNMVENNSEVYARINWPEYCTQTLSSNFTSSPSVDGRIRLKYNQIFFRVDSIGYKGGGSLTSNYNFNTYVKNTSLENAMNVFICPGWTGADGIGQGYYSENENEVKLRTTYSTYPGNNWDPHRLLVHEINHCLGLRHVFQGDNQGFITDYQCRSCQFDDFGCTNHNMGYSGQMIYITKLQYGQIRKALSTSWRKKILVNNTMTHGDHIVNSNYTLPQDNLAILSDNLIIKNGFTLTVDGTIKMSPGKRIVVERGGKLINNGLITSCFGQWIGIIVEGNSSNQYNSGVVEMNGAGTIENANTAISCDPSHIPWPNNTYYGGLIKINSGAIRNCGKAIAFMKYGSSTTLDQSYINGLYVENCNNGITNWASHGINISNSSFQNITQNAVLSIDGSFNINGNTFDGYLFGVSLEATLPGISASEIGSAIGNNFTSNSSSSTAIKATGSVNATQLNIRNNTINSGDMGIHITGGSNYAIRYNTINSSNKGIFLNNTKISNIYPLIEENAINYSQWGILTNNANNTLLFDNCFTGSTSGDIRVVDGSIYQYQGTSSQASGNCFSKNGSLDLSTSSGSPTVTMSYRVKSAPYLACKYPTTPGQYTPNGNYNILFASADDPESCGSGYLGFRVASTSLPANDADYQIELSKHEKELKLLKNDKSADALALIDFHNGEIKKLKLNKLLLDVKARGNGWYKKAIEHAKSIDDFESQTLLLSILIMDKSYDEALSYLNLLPKTTLDQKIFFELQSINLKYLTNTNAFKPTLIELSKMKEWSESKSMFAGLSRSLYFQLTGIRLQEKIQEGIEVEARSSAKKNIVYKVFPNPVQSNELNFTIENFDILDYEPVMKVYSIDGQLLYSKKCNASNKIDTKSWNKGTLLLNVLNDKEEIIFKDKIINQ